MCCEAPLFLLLLRSRTVLYFDSDDDDEGRSHIKESVVIESGTGCEEDSLDNVVAVCPRDREESFFDVVATASVGGASEEKSQLIHDDTELFELLKDVATGDVVFNLFDRYFDRNWLTFF